MRMRALNSLSATSSANVTVCNENGEAKQLINWSN